MLDFRASLLPQARACRDLGSPFMARLMGLLHDRLAPGTKLADRLLDWPGDTSHTGANLALRLAGGLHALVLAGKDDALAAAYPPNEVDDEGLWQAVAAAMRRHAAALDRALDQPPQTNEVRRSAVLIAAAQSLQRRFAMPFVLSEIGASAGLNLHWDRYALTIGPRRYGPGDAILTLAPDWRGPLPEEGAPIIAPVIAERRGVDLAPVDPALPADRLRLLSYIWPDQTERFARTRAALSLPPAPVDRDDALPWLERRLAAPRPGQLHLVFHTLCWPYLAAETRAGCEDLLQAAGARASDLAPLAHFAMEPSADRANTALRLTLWPGGETRQLGTAGFHGEWITWTAAA
jgi:hypothetical protein